jgi:hypothetical protein
MDPMGYSSLNGMGQTMGYLSQHSQHDLMKNVDESSNMDCLVTPFRFLMLAAGDKSAKNSHT